MNHVKAKIALLMLLAFYLATYLPVKAVDTVGVKSGDWIKYNFTMSGGGMSAQGWMKVTIQSVVGTEVNGIYEIGMSGQQLQQFNFTLDIATGYGDLSGFIIPANLTVGQTIPGEAVTVQSVATRHGRTAVFANATDPYTSTTAQMYWDQATGVLLESTASFTGYSYSMTPAETNMWSGGFFGPGFLGLDWWIWIVIIVVIVVVVSTFVAVMLRRRKPPVVPTPQVQPQQPPPPPPPSP